MELVAIDKPPPRKTNITRIFPAILGFVGILFSLPTTRSDLLTKVGHESSIPMVEIQDHIDSIEDCTNEPLYQNLTPGEILP